MQLSDRSSLYQLLPLPAEDMIAMLSSAQVEKDLNAADGKEAK